MTSIAEHYIGMRTQAHELRHQQELDEWVNRRAQQLGVRGAVDEYFEQFRVRVERSLAEYQAADRQLRDDMPRLTQREIAQRERALPTPVYPAWGQQDEDGYARTYGDPRLDPALFGQVQILAAAEWNEIIDSRPVTRAKTNWERTVLEALVHPQDGSVPIFPLNAEGQPIIDNSVMFRTPMTRPTLAVGNAAGVGVEDLYSPGNRGGLGSNGWQPPTAVTAAPAGGAMPSFVPATPAAPTPAAPGITELPPAPELLATKDVPEPNPKYAAVAKKAMEAALATICPYCLGKFGARGMLPHVNKCKANPANITQEAAAVA